MSRIDQALRNWESRKGSAARKATAPELAHASALTNYPSESVNPVTVEEPPARPNAAPLPSRKAATGRRNHADLGARLVTGASGSVSLEQYRRLAAVLHEAQLQGQLKTVMVTSALPGEGKSLTVANLAHTLSGSYGRRVLVLDADLRAPTLHQIFGIPNTVGLIDVLRGSLQELPVVEVSDGLNVLTAGRPGGSPLAELVSDRMDDVIRECAASFDWVLIDTPPVGLLSDAQVLARRVGAVVFVIAAGTTPSAAVARAVSEIGAESVIGTVLNRVDDRRIPDANYYDEYYADEGVEN